MVFCDLVLVGTGLLRMRSSLAPAWQLMEGGLLGTSPAGCHAGRR